MSLLCQYFPLNIYIYIYNISVWGYIVEALWYELTLSEERTNYARFAGQDDSY